MMRTGGASVNLLAHFHYSNDRNNDFSGDQDEKNIIFLKKTHIRKSRDSRTLFPGIEFPGKTNIPGNFPTREFLALNPTS